MSFDSAAPGGEAVLGRWGGVGRVRGAGVGRGVAIESRRLSGRGSIESLRAPAERAAESCAAALE